MEEILQDRACSRPGAGMLMAVRELKRRKRMVKNLDFTRQEPAIWKEQHKLGRHIRESRYLTHLNAYRVELELFKAGKYQKKEELWKHIDLCRGIAGLELSYDKRQLRSQKRTMVIKSMRGRGLLPRHIRKLFHNVCRINSITAIHLEVKCFPGKDSINSQSVERINALGDIPPPVNAFYSDKDYYFFKQLGKYYLYGYELAGYSWGENLEISIDGNVEEENVERIIEEMVDRMEHLLAGPSRPVGSVFKGGNMPSGMLLASGKNIKASAAARRQALAIINSRGYVLHAELQGLFSYNPHRQFVSNSIRRLVKRYGLKEADIGGMRAWTRG